MTNEAPLELGRFRLIAKHWAEQGRAELLFESSDPLQHLKFYTQGKMTSIIVPAAIADMHKLGQIYILYSQNGDISIKA